MQTQEPKAKDKLRGTAKEQRIWAGISSETDGASEEETGEAKTKIKKNT